LRDLARALPRLDALLATPRQRYDSSVQRLGGALGMAASKKRAGFANVASRLRPETLLALITRRREALTATDLRLNDRSARGLERKHAAFDKWASRLPLALTRLIADAGRKTAEGRLKLAQLDTRLQAAPAQRLAALSQRLEALDRTRQTLGYAETLKRGSAVVRGDGHVITSKTAAEKSPALEIEFADGRVSLGARAAKKPGPKGPEQASLF
jgi:exodeoxyribonuclease VII large subunit